MCGAVLDVGRNAIFQNRGQWKWDTQYLPFIYLLLILLCSLLWLNYYHEYWSQTSRQMQIKINHYWYSFKGRHKGGLFLESCFKGDWSKHRAPCFGKKWLCKYQFQNWDQLLLKINRTDATSDAQFKRWIKSGCNFEHATLAFVNTIYLGKCAKQCPIEFNVNLTN